MPTKQAAYATIQTEIARDLPYIPVVLNASQSFFNTKKFSGWPSEDDLYAAPLPYLSVANAVVLTHLKRPSRRVVPMRRHPFPRAVQE